MERITKAKGSISKLEDTIRDLKSEVNELSTSNKTPQDSAEDAENCVRHSNLRLVGFPESVEGSGGW